MIIWISGNTGSGKTFMAELLKREIKDSPIMLDGDKLRGVWNDLGLSKEDRWEHNLRVARLANMLHTNKNIIVSVIAPYRKLREEITNICNPLWIYLPSDSTKDKPYESPVPRPLKKHDSGEVK